MASVKLLEMALAILPPLPHEVTCLRNDGGQVLLTLVEQREEHLFAQLSLLDAREGLVMTIPVETRDGGGFSIGCEITDVYFLGALESGANLTVTEVQRRKPFRAKARTETDSLASLHVIRAERAAVDATVLGRVVDLSASGVGVSTNTELDVGDRLRIETQIGGVAINGEIRVVKAARMAFGRWRLGCQFTRLPLDTQYKIDQLATATTAKATDPTTAETKEVASGCGGMEDTPNVPG
jgi:hypothetical protein